MGTIEEYWAEMHRASNGRYLTGTSGPSTWKECEVESFLQNGKNVLNVGVGLGMCTKDLHNRGVNVYVLDICNEAINKVKEFIVGGFLEKDMDTLPDNFFDLAISHLVAQHMSDEKLENQIKHVVRSLNNDGVFAMQFLTYMTNQPADQDKDREGTNGRSMEQIKEMVEKAGGYISHTPKSIDFKNIKLDNRRINAQWRYVHIRRKNK